MPRLKKYDTRTPPEHWGIVRQSIAWRQVILLQTREKERNFKDNKTRKCVWSPLGSKEWTGLSAQPFELEKVAEYRERAGNKHRGDWISMVILVKTYWASGRNGLNQKC